MKIIFVGDIFCGGDLLKERPSPELIQISEFYEADFRIANLENPLSDCQGVADKCVIYAPTSAVEYLKAFKIDGVVLANNHIQDKEEQGIKDTFDTLTKESIQYCGAGKTLDNAREPLILEKEEEKVAILSYCDFARPYMRQICLATEKSPGVAPLRYEKIIEDMGKLQSDINKVILFFHWGREHTWFPPQHDIDLAKKLLEHPKVSLIVACHSHLPQGCIEYNGKKAFMGIGNFLFPNSFIKPPVQIDYPKSALDYDITHGYHSVYKLTHKRWLKWCRRSLVVSFDTSDDTVHTIFAEQDYLKPVTRKIAPFKMFYILTWVYNHTGRIYHYLSDLWYEYVVFKRWVANYSFYIKQTGLRIFLSKAVNRIKIKYG
jgi:hypothetical protein